MKLYNITIKDHNSIDDGVWSLQTVSKDLDWDKAHKIAIEYLIDSHGLDKNDIFENDIEVTEYYTIDSVDNYKIKLVKE